MLADGKTEGSPACDGASSFVRVNVQAEETGWAKPIGKFKQPETFDGSQVQGQRGCFHGRKSLYIWLIVASCLAIAMGFGLGVGLVEGLKKANSSTRALGAAAEKCGTVVTITDNKMTHKTKLLLCTALSGERDHDFINDPGPFPQIKTLMLASHGSAYNPRTVEDQVNKAADAAGVAGATGSIVLQWLRPQDLTSYGLDDDPNAPWMLWSNDDNAGWKGLSDASSSPDFPRPTAMQFSSLEVFELVLSHMTNCTKFPNLRNIVLVGHSGGGSYMQRIMYASHLLERLRNSSNYAVQIFSAGNTYFSYFDKQRPTKPNAGPGDMRIAPYNGSCIAINTWGCGYVGLPRVLANLTAADAARRHRNTYVTYSVGSEDTEAKDSTCRMALQGSNRVNKQRSWAAYLRAYFGDEWFLARGKDENVAFLEHPKLGHSDAQLGSPMSASYMFNNPAVAAPTNSCDVAPNRGVIPPSTGVLAGGDKLYLLLKDAPRQLISRTT